MMFTPQRPASRSQLTTTATPLEAEELRLRKAYYAKQTAENLLAVGLFDSDSVPVDSGHKKRKKSVGFKLSLKESNPQRSQAVPAQALELDQLPPATPGTLAFFKKQHHSISNHLSSKPSTSSMLKELHHDEMLASKGTLRRERTFVGSSCAACEEPLEHMLRGERILQLSCGHVSHEACFYEYIKEFEVQTCPDCNKPLGLDTSRGGNIDFENLNKLVRSVQTPDHRERPVDFDPTLAPWEAETVLGANVKSQFASPARPSRDHLLPELAHSDNHCSDRHPNSHTRNLSRETRGASRNGHSEIQHTDGRKHDYDAQSLEASIQSPRPTSRKPIPPPSVTIRSEFPTLNRSRHQQSLTCLVTVEVAEGKWDSRPEDLQSPPSIPSPILEEPYEAAVTSPAPLRPAPLHPAPLRPPPPRPPPQTGNVTEAAALEEVTADLFRRVDNWHGLDFERFGRLILHGLVRVGKDRQIWQDLECFLFSEMLVCVKEKKSASNVNPEYDHSLQRNKFILKGSILIKRHLHHVETSYEDNILTLGLSVAELPAFHLQFPAQRQLEAWQRTLININIPEAPIPLRHELDCDTNPSDEDNDTSGHGRAVSSAQSSTGAARSQASAPTEYTSQADVRDVQLVMSAMHVPLDIVVVIPVSASMHGLKMSLLRDALSFMLSSLGERDRMGLVTFGSGVGGVAAVGMTAKDWHGWLGALDSIQAVNQKNLRADVVEGANVAMDLLMQRKTSNPLSHMILISDSPTSDPESVDFVVSRAEAAKISVHSFGLGMIHKPDTMVEMSTRTKASYTYVKDWMMLRECLAGCIGALQSTSHQNVKLRLHLPEGSPAKFIKISGALQVTKRAAGRHAEVSLGDLRFGDKRDILVQLAVQPDSSSPELIPCDPWANIVSGLEALGPVDQDEQRTTSVDELPLLQADLAWSDILREGSVSQLPRPSLLAITLLPPLTRKLPFDRPSTPPFPPHPSIVQRRMELLTSDMLSRALSLVSRGQNDRAHHLLAETRSILKGLGKGGLPPPPPTPPPTAALPPTPKTSESKPAPLERPTPPSPKRHPPSPPYRQADHFSPFSPATGIDPTTLAALDFELESSLEWISHPTVFARDPRKAVLQAIGVISSQRGYTFRTPAETLWGARIAGVRRLTDRSRAWREAADNSSTEGGQF